jgi:hypothetical protein
LRERRKFLVEGAENAVCQLSGLTNEKTGNDQRSIDLIDSAAAECYVTSKELRYRRCGGFEVTVRHARAASGHNTNKVDTVVQINIFWGDTHGVLDRGTFPL